LKRLDRAIVNVNCGGDNWLGTRDWSYAYDYASRLVSATHSTEPAQSRSYGYDAADNMVYNSGLCAANPNLAYPAQGSASVRPHAPTAICGAAVSYDANGNTLAYGSGSAGPLAARSFTYDGENRPAAITLNGATSTFDYGPDGERSQKTSPLGYTWYMGNEAELKLNPDATTLLSASVHPDVRRVGLTTEFLLKDQQGSVRSSSRYGITSDFADYGPLRTHLDYGPHQLRLR
jgi:YD repeat-containing protein